MIVSSIAKELFFEVAEQDGWLTVRDYNQKLEKAKAITGKMLLKSKPIEEIVEFTELP